MSNFKKLHLVRCYSGEERIDEIYVNLDHVKCIYPIIFSEKTANSCLKLIDHQDWQREINVVETMDEIMGGTKNGSYG